jgi:hypothetical protein
VDGNGDWVWSSVTLIEFDSANVAREWAAPPPHSLAAERVAPWHAMRRRATSSSRMVILEVGLLAYSAPIHRCGCLRRHLTCCRRPAPHTASPDCLLMVHLYTYYSRRRPVLVPLLYVCSDCDRTPLPPPPPCLLPPASA